MQFQADYLRGAITNGPSPPPQPLLEASRLLEGSLPPIDGALDLDNSIYFTTILWWRPWCGQEPRVEDP